MNTRYKTGDHLRHQTANHAEESWEAIFGTSPLGPGLRRVRINPNRALPAYSVVQLGSKVTAFGRVLTMELPDNLSEGFGPCYTNYTVDTVAGSEFWFVPIDEFPQLLRVDGVIATGDLAHVTDNGEARRGPGPLQAVSEPDNGVAWFVARQRTDITIQAPAGGIPAATNYAFGSADCIVLVNDGGTWKNSGTTETVYNPSVEAQPAEGLRLGWAAWDGSQYVLISVLCNDDRTFVAPEAL